jgi:hypothetical protein
MQRVLALMIASLAILPAAAQPAKDAVPETVIVNGIAVPNTPDALAHAVIRSIALPGVLLGEIPRWHKGICPRTDGLSSRVLNDYVTNRVRVCHQSRPGDRGSGGCASEAASLQTQHRSVLFRRSANRAG